MLTLAENLLVRYVGMSANTRKVINDFGLMSRVEALLFDTTASNTGVWRGVTSLVEKSLECAILLLVVIMLQKYLSSMQMTLCMESPKPQKMFSSPNFANV